MRFLPTTIPGVTIIEPEARSDARGSFSRIFCREEFAAHSLHAQVEQTSLSHNLTRGTVRGMHYQVPPHAETKVVSCVEGRIFDVCVDVRPTSASFGRWLGVELSARNQRMLYLPEGVAHGFQTLVDGSTVLYQISCAFHPESARGIRWNDPAVGIDWPLRDDLILSEKDQAWPDWPPVTT